MRSLVVHCQCRLPATLLVSCLSFACGTNCISQLKVVLQKIVQMLFIYFSCDDHSKLVPSTSSEPVDNNLPIQEGKQARNLQVPKVVLFSICSSHERQDFTCH